MATMKKQELDALIVLLEDPDQEVHRLVMEKLISAGPGIIPDLESVEILEPETQQRLEQVINAIQFDDISTRLKTWINGTREDLLEPAILISRFQYPSLDEAK